MKIKLYMAVSADGFIAKTDGDSNWVSEADAKNFEKEIEKHGCIVVGNKTYKQFYGDLYPIKGVTNIVMSKNPKQSDNKNVYYAKSVNEAIKIALNKKHKKVLLIGGSTVNGLFLRQNKIDNIILSVHPLIFGKGMPIFTDVEMEKNIELESCKTLEQGLVQVKYKVIK